MNVKDMYDYLRSLSGTEPKIKFYFGIKESNIDMAYQKLDEFVEKIMFFVTEKECVIK